MPVRHSYGFRMGTRRRKRRDRGYSGEEKKYPPPSRLGSLGSVVSSLESLGEPRSKKNWSRQSIQTESGKSAELKGCIVTEIRWHKNKASLLSPCRNSSLHIPCTRPLTESKIRLSQWMTVYLVEERTVMPNVTPIQFETTEPRLF